MDAKKQKALTHQQLIARIYTPEKPTAVALALAAAKKSA